LHYIAYSIEKILKPNLIIKNGLLYDGAYRILDVSEPRKTGLFGVLIFRTTDDQRIITI